MSIDVRPRPVINSVEQFEVLSRYGRGGEIAAIVTGTGLDPDHVSGIVSTLAGFDRGRARQLALDYDRARKGLAARPTVDIEVEPADGIADQLERAAATGDARLVKLVAKVRELLDEIRQRHDGIAAELEAAAAVAEAQWQLEAARARLRALRNPALTDVSTSSRKQAAGATTRERNTQIREWAAKNGHRVAARGRPSMDIVRAYEAATAGVS